MGDFAEAQAAIRSVRFSGDTLFEHSKIVESSVMWARFRNSGVEARAELIPSVAEAASIACKRIGLPSESVRIFVYPSSDIQAECLSISDAACGLRLSSALVERFAAEELEFVIGHEVGHFLLGHLPNKLNEQSIEASKASRAREISCDRAGLIACADIEWALRAIIKTACGLDNRYLRFDAGAYLHHSLEAHAESDDPAQIFSSHPPMVIRARALLWFDEFRKGYFPNFDEKGLSAFRKVDGRVTRDMNTFVEAQTEQWLKSVQRELASWVWVATATSCGRFNLHSQQILESQFGPDFVRKVRGRLLDSNFVEASDWIETNAHQVFLVLKGQFPSRSADILHDLVLKSERALLNAEPACFLRKTAWCRS